MSEMLANQYFLTRKYNLAAKELEESVLSIDNNKKIIKKLIICYTQINKPVEALDSFLRLINSDIDIIMKTDINADDCPCFELIDRIKCNYVKYEDEFTKSYILGILYLYCNLKQSLKYFETALKLDPSNKTIINVIEILKDKNNNYS
jgi:tetratricopeptide (TPR) repeat protein